MKKLFIILAVMAIIIGCAEQHPPQFRQVWKKINKPEEARVILAKVNTNALTESGKAEYGLWPIRCIENWKMTHSYPPVLTTTIVMATTGSAVEPIYTVEL